MFRRRREGERAISLVTHTAHPGMQPESNKLCYVKTSFLEGPTVPSHCVDKAHEKPWDLRQTTNPPAPPECLPESCNAHTSYKYSDMHADESARVIELRIIPKNKRKQRRLNGRPKSRHVIIVKDRLIRVVNIDEVVS